MFKEFIDFAKYVVSKEREESFRNNQDTDVPVDERLRGITDADLENWSAGRGGVGTIALQNENGDMAIFLNGDSDLLESMIATAILRDPDFKNLVLGAHRILKNHENE